MLCSFAYVAVLVALPSLVLADSCDPSSNPKDGFVSLVCYSKSAKLNALYNSGDQPGDLSGFVNRVFVFAISIGGVLAVLRLGWGAFQYAASDLWTNKEKGKSIIKDTLLGIVLLLAVYIILKQIDSNLLNLNINAMDDGSALKEPATTPVQVTQ